MSKEVRGQKNQALHIPNAGFCKFDSNMNRDFSTIMADRTDKELVDIVTLKHEHYESEALVAAVNELEKRKIDPETFYSEAQIQNVRNDEVGAVEIRPFRLIHKISIVALPLIVLALSSYVAKRFFNFEYGAGVGFCLIFIIQRLIYQSLKDSSNLKRAAEFKKWVAYTIYIYLCLAVIATLYVLLFGIN